MSESSLVLFIGCVSVFVAYAVVLARTGTAMLGLNALNVFTIASATLSAFVCATLFDIYPQSFSDEHSTVISYSILGLLALVAGLYIGWRPLVALQRKHGPHYVWAPPHLNAEIGLLTFCIGAVAELAYPFVQSIPTISTAVYCVTALVRVGLCILLLSASKGEGRGRFAIALAVFVALSVVTSLSTGFSFIRINTWLPLTAVWLIRSSTGSWVHRMARAGILLVFAATLATAATTAWLQTRALIRNGSLEQLPLSTQVAEFAREYVSNLRLPTGDSLMNTLLERVDVTDLLAAQVRYQPQYEPYAYGETILSSFYTLVPRAFWPEKPVVAGGSEFVGRFTGLQWNDATSVGLSYPFELYANGGILLVVLGLGIIGYVGARLELSLGKPQPSLGAFWALCLATAVITEGGQRTDVVLPALVASAITAYALGMVVEKVFLRRGFLKNTDVGSWPAVSW